MTTLIAIAGLGLLSLLFEILNLRKGIVPMVLLGLLACLGLAINDYSSPAAYYNNMVVVTRFSAAFTGLFIILTFLIVAMSADFHRKETEKLSDFVSLKLFLLLGAVTMVSFGNLAMFFLGIEILSVAVYILAASNRLNLKSNEAGMKYFLMGAFASGILLFGICLVYGAMGSFDLAEIGALTASAELPEWFLYGVVLLSVGMLFKAAAVPFHFWAPDVYEGAPTLTTTVMSTLVKVTVLATFYKLLVEMQVILTVDYLMMIAVVAVASMFVGNIMALRQTNVKRMLAFSGIGHAGYMLMTLLNTENSSATLLFYTAAYALAGIAAFTVVLYVCRDTDNEELFNFNGLGKTNPAMAGILTLALISMAGIPIMGGFMAKFTLFTDTISAGYLWVVICAVITSIISVGYYFKLILAMYNKNETQAALPQHPVYLAVGLIAILMNLGMGLFPSLVFDLLS